MAFDFSFLDALGPQLQEFSKYRTQQTPMLGSMLGTLLNPSSEEEMKRRMESGQFVYQGGSSPVKNLLSYGLGKAGGLLSSLGGSSAGAGAAGAGTAGAAGAGSLLSGLGSGLASSGGGILSALAGLFSDEDLKKYIEKSNAEFKKFLDILGK